MQAELDRLRALGFDEQIVSVAEKSLGDLQASFGDTLEDLLFVCEKRELPEKLKAKADALPSYRADVYLSVIGLLRDFCLDLHPEAALKAREKRVPASLELPEEKSAEKGASDFRSVPAPEPLDTRTVTTERRLTQRQVFYDNGGPDGGLRFFLSDDEPPALLKETETRFLLRPHPVWGWRQRPVGPLSKAPEIPAWDLGEGFTLPAPTTENVWAVLNALGKDPRYLEAERERHALFDVGCPENRDSDVILKKMAFITSLTGAKLPDPRGTALRIARAGKLDEALWSGMAEAAVYHVDGSVRARYGGFASLYCHAHTPEAVPLYTPFTLEALRRYRDETNCGYYLDREVLTYESYRKVLRLFLEVNDVRGVSAAKFSLFLEVVGRRTAQ